MIKGIMFDMGGTLVENKHMSIKKGIEKIYNHIDSVIDKKVFFDFCMDFKKDTLDNRTTFDIKFIDFLSFILKFFNCKIDISDEEMEIEFANAFSDNIVIEYIEDVLKKAKKENLKLIVLSNTFFSSKTIKNILDNCNIGLYFDEIIASSDCLVRKPSIHFFEYGIKRLNLKKEEVMYVGNDYNSDCVGCMNTGIPIIFYNHNHYHEYVLNNKIYEIDSYFELLKVNLCQIF